MLSRYLKFKNKLTPKIINYFCDNEKTFLEPSESFIQNSESFIQFIIVAIVSHISVYKFRILHLHKEKKLLILTVLKSQSKNRQQLIVREGFAEVILAEWVSS